MTHEDETISESLGLLEAESRIDGVIVKKSPVFADSRGWLTELIKGAPGWENVVGEGLPFTMSYVSLTMPGEKRDVDQWHHHDETLPGGGQADRFIVLFGQMILALYDDREESATKGKLEIIKLQGANWETGQWPVGGSSILLIPPGVKHCIANLSERPFLLQNFPSKIYDGQKEKECKQQGSAWLEGRTSFVDIPILQLGGQTFSWDIVEGLLTR